MSTAAHPGNFYATPELAAHYDEDFAGRPDLPFYLRLAEELGAATVADVGAGTGLLCSLLAARGHAVIGVEPQATMLALARSQEHARAVTWVHGTADDLLDACADLVVMTGHVAQYFLDDAAWVHVLRQVHRALRPGGHLAFEVRNDAREEWRTWPTAGPQGTGWGTVHTQVERQGDLVTHTERWSAGDRVWTTAETLRFPSWDAVATGLDAAGFQVASTWGDWDGQPVEPGSPEWIVLARPRISTPE